jgi:hypothetical protein
VLRSTHPVFASVRVATRLPPLHDVRPHRRTRPRGRRRHHHAPLPRMPRLGKRAHAPVRPPPAPTLASLARTPFFSSLASPRREAAHSRLFDVSILTRVFLHSLPSAIGAPPSKPPPLVITSTTRAHQRLCTTPLNLPVPFVALPAPQLHRSTSSSGRRRRTPPCKLADSPPP